MGLQDSYPGVYSTKAEDGHQQAIAASRHWVVSHSVSVGTGTAVGVLMSIPATGVYHASITCEAKKAGNFTFCEAPNASGGTALVSYNSNRRTATTDSITFTHTPTYVSSGTVIESHLNTVGIVSTQEEMILANSQLYLARFTADAASTEIGFSIHYWKEA